MKRIVPLISVIAAFISLGCNRLEDTAPTRKETKTQAPDLTIKAEQYLQPTSIANAQIISASDETNFDYNNKNVKVKVYSRNVGDSQNSPVFKYADLLNRAIAYKNANPQTNVEVKFAMYTIGMGSYFGFNPADPSYGFVKGNDHGGASSEKLPYSIVKAALNQVSVDFVYQNDIDESVYNYIFGFMENPCTTDPSKKVKDYLRIRQVTWGAESYQQMHAKFMTVSHYSGDTGSVLNTTYCTTANIDDHDNSGIPSGKDWVQSGILINGHPELMASYNKYFNLIYDNYNNQQNFHSAVRAMHASNSLNYDDEHFSSYFTPLPLSPQGNYVAGKSDKSSVQGNAWDVNFNPVAKYTSQMATQTGNRYLKVNVYHFKMDNFGTTFYNELANIYNSNSSGTKHFRFVVKENTYESTFSLTNLNNIGIVKFPKPTHAKDITFAFSNIGSYYTLTGSTNLKLDDNLSKANSTIVVKEFTSEHPIYNAYKDIYNYQY